MPLAVQILQLVVVSIDPKYFATQCNCGDEDVGGDVGEDGGGDEEPSKLREEKVGRSGLSTLVTWRLPDSGVGDGRWWREGGGRGSPSGTLVAASAKEAWWAAARWLRRAFALGPRWRRR